MTVINKDWHIEYSGGCYSLMKKCKVLDRKTKEEKDGLSHEGYFGSVYDCLKAFMRKSMDDATDVADAINRIDNAIKDINKMKGKLK